MTFTESINTCFSKYATFDGRASRSELWWFYLFFFLVNIAAIFLDELFNQAGNGTFYLLWLGAMALPLSAVYCRRLHDRGLSGWWQLFPWASHIGPLLFIDDSSDVPDISPSEGLLILAILGGSLWILVMWCLPTKPKENQYGLPPGDVAVKTAEESTD